jgi:hypothetical protein
MKPTRKELKSMRDGTDYFDHYAESKAMSDSEERLHLLTSKFIQFVVLPPTQMFERQLYALTEHGQMWNYNEATNEWHFVDAERILPR